MTINTQGTKTTNKHFIIKTLVKSHCTAPQASSSTVNARHPQAIRLQRHLPSPTGPADPKPQGST